jgi:hypothetical protein
VRKENLSAGGRLFFAASVFNKKKVPAGFPARHLYTPSGHPD